MDENLIRRARSYATEMHERITQRRKYTNVPYDVHLKAVADLVGTVTSDPEVIAAAWLHDTVEDTPATFENIEQEFGPAVMALIRDLTDVSRPGDGNRAVRKELDRNHLAAASPRAKTVKLADIIDNTRDIARHDPRFAHTYLPEMFRLLEVLTEGDAKLYKKAQATVGSLAKKLGIPPPPPENAAGAIEPDISSWLLTQFRGIHVFTESFTARSIFEPLRSYDRGTASVILQRAFADPAVSVLGIRDQGHLTGYLISEDLGEGRRVKPRRFATLQIVSLESPLVDIIHALTYYSHCFVTLDNEIIGFISRADIEKPAVRMWLFGLIMLIDLSASRSIAENFAEESWQRSVPQARLAKAKELHLERQRQKKPGSLLECLQLSDKLQILGSDPDFLETSGFPSVGAAKRIFKGLESLRNNLAHGQEIASFDWPSIVRLARLLRAISGVGEG